MATKTKDVPSSLRIEGGVALTSGVLKYPSQRDALLKNAQLWIEGKREDDAVFPFWRIHNKLYDLSEFKDKHPGGRFWIEATQGTDITEAFECSHFGPLPDQILRKYFVEETSKPRVSPFTFEPNGFYRTLKRKASPILKEVGRGPTRTMALIQDSLVLAFMAWAIWASAQNSAMHAVVAGAILTLAANSAHNFFHQRDNWRMYIFNMMLLSYHDWRISHVLSHHIFTNTIYDYEITMFEPHLNFLPKASKAALSRLNVMVRTSVIVIIGFYMDLITKFILVLKGKVNVRPADSLPLIQLLLMAFFGESLSRALWLWFIMHTSANIFFFVIGIDASHHHPEIYHEGDSPPQKDWGLHQIVSTGQRGQIFQKSLFLASVSYGNHTLHHLFPTVDQSKLVHLLPAFLETCQEFGVKFEVFTAWELVEGCFQRLLSSRPSIDILRCFIKSN